MLVQSIIALIRAEIIKSGQKPDNEYLNSLTKLKKKDNQYICKFGCEEKEKIDILQFCCKK